MKTSNDPNRSKAGNAPGEEAPVVPDQERHFTPEELENMANQLLDMVGEDAGVPRWLLPALSVAVVVVRNVAGVAIAAQFAVVFGWLPAQLGIRPAAVAAALIVIDVLLQLLKRRYTIARQDLLIESLEDLLKRFPK